MAVELASPPLAADLQRLMHEASAATSGHAVFGDPIASDGVIVVTAARIRGGAGAGAGGQAGEISGSGWGSGATTIAEPVGAYVIRNGDVRWQPAVDVTTIMRRLVIAWMFVALAGIRLARRRARRSSAGDGSRGGA